MRPVKPVTAREPHNHTVYDRRECAPIGDRAPKRVRDLGRLGQPEHEIGRELLLVALDLLAEAPSVDT
jgi:hypothetical protein